VCLLAACWSAEAEPDPDDELRSLLGLTRAIPIYHVTLSGAGARDSLSPALIEVTAGAVVEMRVLDARTHAVAFVLDQLPEANRAFLERTHQLFGPALIDPDSRFVVSFAGAPPGRYPFRCLSHPETGRGLVIVRPN
jgi:plastocyanin